MNFDYLIVGAGSAGCVVANRLSEDTNNTVAIFEAGGSSDIWKVKLMVGSTTKQYLFLRSKRPLIVAFFFQTNDALFATSKASCIIKPILDRSLHASNSARVPNYLSTDNPTNN